MKISPVQTILLSLIFLSLPACDMHKDDHGEHEEHHRIVVTTPKAMDVTVTQPYVCQIRSQRYIEVCALDGGRLEEIPVKEGQAVKAGDVMFKIVPVLYQTKLDVETAEVQFAQREYDNAKRLAEDQLKVISQQEVLLYKAKLEKAIAKQRQAEAELNFATVRAPFDGIMNRQLKQQGSTIKEGEMLTTLSDNSVMWVYFNVPEVRYLDYKAHEVKTAEHSQHLKLADSRIELQLADGSKFKHDGGDTVTVEATFNNETGNIAFRADFPNPDRLLRHGQTGTVLVHQTLHNSNVIPQRATFEILEKMYVYVIGADHVVHQREISVQHEKDDIFIIKPPEMEHGKLVKGLLETDKIVFEGVRQVHDGQKVEDFEFLKPEEALANQKHHAE
ncbi:efflux RND transporter periplasmic adaptor subunit [Limnoglobus roseus]|uniref:Efflux RND transporter periplasmic adaptor subunit n=1 Tax=Limnoglobus roseus TaxID=2598579 RepID=A0A5C1ANR8_9BACT|nr:efflux RND transporter periplasmic adaptor subunit [Limnoglobus roseus]QEL19773.1 efflux RND transporter periplasmic adaptor subunit [Limnoglobus roseus]